MNQPGEKQILNNRNENVLIPAHIMKRQPIIIILALLVVSLVLTIVSLMFGSVSITPGNLWSSLRGVENDSTLILSEIRFPRAVAAFTTGALLAQAGALMQVLVRNPLADPYILGISGGAATAVLLGMLIGLSSSFGLTGLAFVGALVAMVLVFFIAHRKGNWSPSRLLLTGVVIAAGWGALISLILAISPARNLHGMLFWLMGDLGYSHSLLFSLISLLAGLLLSLWLAPGLNVLIRGEKQAASLGINLGQIQTRLYVIASLITATAVVQAGSIGFVGFIVPHLVRLAGITDYRYLLPAATLGGGALVLIADTVARTVIAPQQLPVGIITALIGIPLFLFLLQRDNKS